MYGQLFLELHLWSFRVRWTRLWGHRRGVVGYLKGSKRAGYNTSKHLCPRHVGRRQKHKPIGPSDALWTLTWSIYYMMTTSAESNHMCVSQSEMCILFLFFNLCKTSASVLLYVYECVNTQHITSLISLRRHICWISAYKQCIVLTIGVWNVECDQYLVQCLPGMGWCVEAGW